MIRTRSLPLLTLRNRNAAERVSIPNVYDLSVWNERQIRKPSSPRPRIAAKNRHRRLPSLYRSRSPLRLPLRFQIGSFVSKSLVRCFDPKPLSVFPCYDDRYQDCVYQARDCVVVGVTASIAANKTNNLRSRANLLPFRLSEVSSQMYVCV